MRYFKAIKDGKTIGYFNSFDFCFYSDKVFKEIGCEIDNAQLVICNDKIYRPRGLRPLPLNLRKNYEIIDSKEVSKEEYLKNR